MENRWHFAHPQHQLQRTPHNQWENHRVCYICDLPVTGAGYRCNHCNNFHIHDGCADRFGETIPSFFAHPRHPLTAATASAKNAGSWWCDLCRGQIQPGRLVYRCAQCAFDVHPLCALLPMAIRAGCPRRHDLNLVPARGECTACRRDCSIWHYRCGLCMFMLHIGCVSSPAGASGAPAGGARGWPAAGTAAGFGGGSPIARFLFMVAQQLAVNFIVSDMTDVIHALQQAVAGDY